MIDERIKIGDKVIAVGDGPHFKYEHKGVVIETPSTGNGWAIRCEGYNNNDSDYTINLLNFMYIRKNHDR